MKNDKGNILRAACYIRVSTTEQALKGYSIETQIDTLKEYCKDNNMRIVDTYIDAGVSGSLPPTKRPALKRLLEDVEDDKIDVLVFVKLDRWFRSVKHYHKTQEILERHSVEWIAALENYDTRSANGRFAITVFLAVAQNEQERTGERIKAVFEHKRKNKESFFGAGSCPFGYTERKDENGVRRLVKDEEVKDALQTFFDIAIKYENISKAAKEVNLEYGLTKARHKWIELAKKEIYCGNYRGVEGYCEPYISVEDWNKLNSRNLIKNNTKNRVYMFTGLIECPICHNNLRASYTRQKRKNGSTKEYYNYRCEYKTVGNCAYNHTISEIKIEKWLLNNIERLIGDEIANVEIEELKPRKKKKSKLPALKERLRRLEVIYMSGNKTDDEYIAESKEINGLINAAELEEGGEDTHRDLSQLKELLNIDFKGLYNELNREDKRRFWRTLIKRIYVQGNSIVSVDFN